MQTTIDGAVASKDNQNVYEKDGKIWAKTSWLRLWPKNPRVIDKKNLKKLENQIKELGVYKPLVVTPDGEILGGNQRFKVISELAKTDKRFDSVWVSVVEAWTDQERLKYALSDNFSAGEYTRDKLREILTLEQRGLFSDYDVEFTNKQDIDDFIDQLAITEEELRFKDVKKNLQALGINDETIKTLETMTTYNKMNEDLPDVDLKGCITGQKFPMLFWFEDEILFNQFQQVYGDGHKDRYLTDKLVNLTEKQLNTKFPTAEDELVRLSKEIEELTINEIDSKELGGNWEKISGQKSKVVETFKSLFSKTYPVEANEVLFGNTN